MSFETLSKKKLNNRIAVACISHEGYYDIHENVNNELNRRCRHCTAKHKIFHFDGVEIRCVTCGSLVIDVSNVIKRYAKIQKGKERFISDVS